MRGQEGRQLLDKLLARKEPPRAMAGFRSQRLEELIRSLPDLSWPLPERTSLPADYAPPEPGDAAQAGHTH
jgi:hypothetical protein